MEKEEESVELNYHVLEKRVSGKEVRWKRKKRKERDRSTYEHTRKNAI